MGPRDSNMSHSGGSSDPDWSFRELEHIDAVCDGFERAWNSQLSVRIEDLLDNHPDLPQSQLLFELVRLERHLRQSVGESPGLDEYLSRFPNHQSVIAHVWRQGSAASTSEDLAPSVTLSDTTQFSEADTEPEQLS